MQSEICIHNSFLARVYICVRELVSFCEAMQVAILLKMHINFNIVLRVFLHYFGVFLKGPGARGAQMCVFVWRCVQVCGLEGGNHWS